MTDIAQNIVLTTFHKDERTDEESLMCYPFDKVGTKRHFPHPSLKVKPGDLIRVTEVREERTYAIVDGVVLKDRMGVRSYRPSRWGDVRLITEVYYKGEVHRFAGLDASIPTECEEETQTSSAHNSHITFFYLTLVSKSQEEKFLRELLDEQLWQRFTHIVRDPFQLNLRQLQEQNLKQYRVQVLQEFGSFGELNRKGVRAFLIEHTNLLE